MNRSNACCQPPPAAAECARSTRPGAAPSLIARPHTRADRRPGLSALSVTLRVTAVTALLTHLGRRPQTPSPPGGVMYSATVGSKDEPMCANIEQVPRSGTVRTNGQELYYEIHGDG